MKVEGIRETQPAIPLRPVTGGEAGASEKGPVKTEPVKYEDLDKLYEEKDDSLPVEKAVDLINKTMESYNTELQFTLHKDSGEYIVKIINSKDNSVIREIPPERVLDMVAHFKKMLGIIVDKFI